MAKSSKVRRPQVLLVNRSFVKREDGKLLIMKRSPTDLNNAGKWEVPGGKVDEGQDLTGAQEREVREETGLLVKVTLPFATLETKSIMSGRYRNHLYLAIFHVTEIVGGHFALSDEHTDFAWVTYDELFSYDLTQEVWKAAIVLKSHLV